MAVELTSDEMILAVVSLVRVIDPKLLRQGSDGFQVDFDRLRSKDDPSADERLLLKLNAALDTGEEESSYKLEMTGAEGRRLTESLEHLERLQNWPADVMTLSRNLRARLPMPADTRMMDI
ncbi:MAG: hypothetical protein HY046_11215 [Acidobacteria bacterium]|nr:hypothetical protein [Acidobacteriota bacterium]